MKPVFLMSPPRQDWTLRGKANFRSQAATPVDPVRAREEWAALADAIVAADGEVLVVPPNPRINLTGMIYTAEAGEFFVGEDGAPRFLLPNMAAEHRRPEADWIGGFVEGLGWRTLAIGSTWEAQGDALRADGGQKIVHTFGSGRYRRTEATAYEEVAHLLSPAHIQIHFQADPWFHGNTFLAIYQGASMPERLGDEGPRSREVVVICPDALVPGELERLEAFLPEAEFVQIGRSASEGYDTNSLQVGEKVIASETISAATREALKRAGLELVALDLGELFLKGGGAPVCLTNRLWGLDPEALPERVRWSARPEIAAHTSF